MTPLPPPPPPPSTDPTHLIIACLALTLSTAILALGMVLRPEMVPTILPVTASVWTGVLGAMLGIQLGKSS